MNVSSVRRALCFFEFVRATKKALFKGCERTLAESKEHRDAKKN